MIVRPAGMFSPPPVARTKNAPGFAPNGAALKGPPLTLENRRIALLMSSEM